jgi:hypothetical protein
MYAAKRKAIDRAILAEAERAIELEEAAQRAPMAQETAILDRAARIAIARAFGRPVKP